MSVPGLAQTSVPSPQQTYGARNDVVAWAEAWAEARGVEPGWALQQLARARYVPAVSRLMMPPPAGVAKDWKAYRSRFLDAPRVQAGVAFWRAHESLLEQAHARWGVPPAMVVGILGVETYYGRITGQFRVIDALATLSFDFPTGRRDRTPFFQAQLGEYLHWCHREQLDCQALLGSYAGAMGWPQFMPESIVRWAIDFDEDGHIDLMKSPADIIGSVAHYFAAHGWQRDMPTHHEVVPPTDANALATLLGPDIKPTFSVQAMQGLGATFKTDAAQNHPGPLALVELHNGTHGAPSYVAGTENFYVVTRYNWSSYYALAVIELGEAVQRAMHQPTMQQPSVVTPVARTKKKGRAPRTVARAP